MSTGGFRVVAVLVVGLLALMPVGCGKKKKKKDPVATALMEPGVRTLVIPKQSDDVTIVVTPCTAAAVEQSSTRRKPPGSNEIIVPKGTLSQTVAVPPCPEKPAEAAANTVLVSPGGPEQVPPEPPMNQLVLPSNSNVRTVIIPPCTMSSGKTGAEKKTLAFPVGAEKKRTVTAPPCMAMPK